MLSLRETTYMTLKELLTPAAVGALLAVSTLPAAADSRDRDDHARARVGASRPAPQDQRAERGRSSDTRAYAVPRNDRVAPRAIEPARRSDRDRRPSSAP